MSEETARNIDKAIAAIISGACQKALSILSDNRAMLEKLADALVERETLSDSEIRELLWQKHD
jgi:cell division protease FtsH